MSSIELMIILVWRDGMGVREGGRWVEETARTRGQIE